MYSKDGLCINGVKVSLDEAKSEICFVSHAHSDHTAPFLKKRNIIASDETFQIMGREPDSFKIPQVSLHCAGHMLGARQMAVELDGSRFVYTGDFSLHESYTFDSGKILECDTLMIDSTYCLPHLRMPNRDQVIENMKKFVNSNINDSIIVFGAYVRGKTQELVRFLNIECKIAPIVSESSAKICSFYEKCGVKLDYIPLDTPEADEVMRSNFTAILPAGKVNFSFGAKMSSAYECKVKTAVASGWAAVTKFPVDGAFPLSDHADFKDTMRYIHSSGAKKIICANSGSSNAAEYLRSIGINATAKEEFLRGVQTTIPQCIEKDVA